MTDIGPMHGKYVLVTGGTGGIGLATATGLAGLGARVGVVGRSAARGAVAADAVRRKVPSAQVDVFEADMSSQAQVRRLAAEVEKTYPRLDVLVNNVGGYWAHRHVTADGLEHTFALNHLAPFLLTHELRDLLAADGDARVVFVTSGGMYTAGLDLDDPELTHTAYSGTRAYAHTKRMQVHLAEEWARRLAPDRVAVHSTHPGWAGTPGLAGSLPGFNRLVGPLLRSAEAGADTTVWLLAAPEGGSTTGRLWHDRAPRPTAYLSRTRPTPDQVRRLWDLVVAATGVPAAS